MVIVGSWILLSGLVSDQEKNLLLTLCPPLLSVLFEIELGEGEGEKSWQIGPKMSFPFFSLFLFHC